MLLLDEPLSNLDAKLREDMQVELRQIHRTAGATTLLVTHDQAEALALSDRIVVLNNGRVEQIGTPFEVYERPATPFVAAFLGKTNVMRARMNREAAGAQITIGSSRWLSDRFVDDEVFVSVRPEKIDFASEGPHALPGTVSARIFQGNHWLYHVETAFGLITVIRQNSGFAAPAEGAQVYLAIQTEDMTIRATNGAHA
jgi:putative spermidine/putrescine transport system ATP-binding protein